MILIDLIQHDLKGWSGKGRRERQRGGFDRRGGRREGGGGGQRGLWVKEEREVKVLEREEEHRNGNGWTDGRRARRSRRGGEGKRSGEVDAVRTGEEERGGQVNEDRMCGMRGDRRSSFSCSLLKDSRVLRIQERYFIEENETKAEGGKEGENCTD